MTWNKTPYQIKRQKQYITILSIIDQIGAINTESRVRPLVFHTAGLIRHNGRVKHVSSLGIFERKNDR